MLDLQLAEAQQAVDEHDSDEDSLDDFNMEQLPPPQVGSSFPIREWLMATLSEFHCRCLLVFGYHKIGFTL